MALIQDMESLFLDGSYDALSKAFIELNQGQCICADWRNHIWYQFRDDQHHWSRLSEQDLYLVIRDQLIQKAKSYPPSEKLMKTIFRLGNYTTLLQICKRLRDNLYDKNFMFVLDRNSSLIGFENGVYDTSTQTFRPGQIGDYLSWSTKINYLETHDHEQQLMTYLRQIIPNEEQLTQLLKSMTQFLMTRTIPYVYFLNGIGSNGASFIIQLFRHTLGDYYDHWLTQEELPLVVDTQMLSLEKVQPACDRCHTDQSELILYWHRKVGMICDQCLTHIGRRVPSALLLIKEIKLPTIFVDQPTLPNHQKRDPHLLEQIPQWSEVFGSILLHYAKIDSQDPSSEIKNI